MSFGGSGAKPIEPRSGFGGTGQKEVLTTPLDPKDASYYGKKTIGDIPVNERHWYIKGVWGYKKKLDIAGYERPLRYVTQTEAHYLTNGSPPEVTSIIMEPIALSFPQYPREYYLRQLEEVIIVAVPDEERSAYPSYPPVPSNPGKKRS